ncbi:hypothetical protein [Bradyrhizobium sp. CCBAU 11361]|nr:hypothetical protein [Bradyrhizobium sp. CCBAU 11361]
MMVFIPASASVRVLRQRLNGSEAVLDPMLEFPDKKRQSLLGRGPSRELVAAGDHRGLPAPLATYSEVVSANHVENVPRSATVKAVLHIEVAPRSGREANVFGAISRSISPRFQPIRAATLFDFARSLGRNLEGPMSAKLRFFLAGAATAIAIIAVGFGGGALFASSASKQVRPARIEHQATAPTPAVRVALPATSEPVAPTPVLAVDLSQEKAQQTQLPPQAQSEAQTEERPKTRRELREERRKLRVERRAEGRERRHHRKASQQQEASRNGEIPPQ